jgi:Holliday junction resolvase RusA-like endonuclease
VQLTITVPGKPVGTNNAYRRRGNAPGFYMTDDAKSFKERLRAYAVKAIHEADWKKLVKTSCSVTITVYNATRYDADSPTKFVLDSMQDLVYDNDRCVTTVSSTKMVDGGQARVEITVETL